MHVRLADESVCIGPPPAAKSYLNIPRHHRRLRDHRRRRHPSRLRLPVGERPLRRDRRGARHHLHRPDAGAHPHHGRQDHGQADGARRSASPWCPAPTARSTDDEEAMTSAEAIGFPVLIKAAAGGGGRGMKVARTAGRPGRCAVTTARAEAKAAFGDDTRLHGAVPARRPRHIEIQVIADGHGNVVHLGERDCSLQRRHQKVLEEAPSPALNAEQRARRSATIVAEAMQQDRLPRRRHHRVPLRGRRVLLHRDEHPPAGGASGHRGDHRHRPGARADPRRRRARRCRSRRRRCIFEGHAIECRINAENPRTFTPSPGMITDFHAPGGLGVRVDCGVYAGYSHPALLRQPDRQADRPRPNRDECLMRLRRAWARSSSAASRPPSRCSRT